MKKILSVFFALALTTGCKEKYNPSIRYPDTGYLVVEGFINSGQGPTQINLSRTLALNDVANIQRELAAEVTVEGDDNLSYPLAETGNGSYVNSQLPLNGAGKYRLHIKTSNGKEYFSDFAAAIRTPAIDSIGWTWGTDGVQISAHAHDPQNNTHYYTWNYEETWEIDASYLPFVRFTRDQNQQISGLEYINADHSPDTSGKRCWKFNSSSRILTGSSAKLAQDVIHMPLLLIQNESEKLNWLYSVLVIQRAASAQGYEFLQRLKKNTEETGSIFDSQPSELNTNIHNIADPAEVVVGYIDVADRQESRIFIDPGQVPGWNYSQGCKYIYVYPRNDVDSLKKHPDYSPVEYNAYNGIPAVFMGTPVCVDCRLSGGINQKPPFWPR